MVTPRDLIKKIKTHMCVFIQIDEREYKIIIFFLSEEFILVEINFKKYVYIKK